MIRMIVVVVCVSASLAVAQGPTTRPAGTAIALKVAHPPLPAGAAAGRWHRLHEPAELGVCRVAIKSMKEQKVALQDVIAGRTTSKNDLVVIFLTITNTSGEKKFSFQSWGDELVNLDRAGARLVDDLGNGYRRVTFGLTTDVIGRTKDASVYPGKSVTDVLVFELPVVKARRLYLVLPGQRASQEGSFCFVTRIERPGSPSPRVTTRPTPRRKPTTREVERAKARDAARKAAAAEKDAAGRLALARNYLAAGMAANARALLKQIVDKWPNTKAAREARHLLKD